MLQIKHILFPVDFSEQCSKIVPVVQAWSAHFGARVTVLNVLEMPAAYYTDWSGFIEAVDIDSLLKERTQRLELFAADAFRGTEDQRIVTEDVVSMAILDFVNRESVNLIMMPTHGYGPFRRFLLGSLTAKVLHDSTGPVWTGVHAERMAAELSPDCHRILCAVDLTPQSACVIHWAKELADSYGAQLRLVHAVTGCPEAMVTPEEGRFRAFMFDFARQEIGKLQQQAGTQAEIDIRGGEIASAVAQAAVDFNSDMVVIGRGILQQPFGRLRSKSYAIIRESPCPVLSV